MGCYDTVRFRCLKCGDRIHVQSKGGSCRLKTYTPNTAPANTLGYIDKDLITCDSCGSTFQIKVEARAYLEFPEDTDNIEEEDY